MVAQGDGTVIRAATVAELDGLLALESTFPSDRLSRRAFRHHLASPGSWLAVATREDQPVGYVMVLFRRDRAWARLYSVVVSEAARGQGLATRLMAAAEGEVIRRGLRELRLEVRADNPSALGMYERRGYVRTQILTSYYTDGADGLRLKRVW